MHAPVGSFEPNRFGVRDAHGNVWEWCRDCRTDYGRAARPGDGLREDPSVSPRVYRGGSFGSPAVVVRSAYRWGAPGSRIGALGLGPARSMTP